MCGLCAARRQAGSLPTEDRSPSLEGQSGVDRFRRPSGVTARSCENTFVLACAASVGSFPAWFPLSDRLWSCDRPFHTSRLSNGLLQLHTLSVWHSESCHGGFHSRTAYPLYNLAVDFMERTPLIFILSGEDELKEAPSTTDEMRKT